MTSEHQEIAEPARRPVNIFRVLLLGSAMAVPCAFWLQYAEMVQREGLFAWESALPLPAVAGLMLLVVLSGILKALGVERWLPRGEILLVYLFLLISVPLASIGLAQSLLSHLTAGHYYGDQNSLALDHLPDWIAPNDPAHLNALYERTPEDVTFSIWSAPDGGSYGAWLLPMAKWMIFLAALFGFCLCVGLLIETQWTVSERLRHPLTAPALELTASGPTRLLDRPLVSNPVMWFGVAWSVFYCGSAVLAAFIPTFKALYFSTVIGPLRVSYRPIVLGIAYLAPTNLSLSIWVFEFVKAGQELLGDFFGLSGLRGTTLPTSQARFPFHSEQAMGAFICIAFISFWMARGHILQVMKSVIGDEPNEEQRRIRRALTGLVVCGGVMLAWLVLNELWSGGVLMLLVMTLFIALTHARIRAEAGAPVIGTKPFAADLMMVSMVGSLHFSGPSLAQLGLFGFLSHGYFPLLLSTQIDSLKIAREALLRRRDLIVTLFAALLVGSFVGIWSLLYFWYGDGAENLLNWPIKGAQRSFRAAVAHMKYQSGMDWYASSALAAGFLFTALLSALRRWFWFWPLHPLGYAISQTSSTHLWGMFLVAWAIKAAVMRYGGVRAYRTTVPFFFGIVFGQIGMQMVGNLLKYFFNVRIYISAF